MTATANQKQVDELRHSRNEALDEIRVLKGKLVVVEEELKTAKNQIGLQEKQQSSIDEALATIRNSYQSQFKSLQGGMDAMNKLDHIFRSSRNQQQERMTVTTSETTPVQARTSTLSTPVLTQTSSASTPVLRQTPIGRKVTFRPATAPSTVFRRVFPPTGPSTGRFTGSEKRVLPVDSSNEDQLEGMVRESSRNPPAKISKHSKEQSSRQRNDEEENDNDETITTTITMPWPTQCPDTAEEILQLVASTTVIPELLETLLVKVIQEANVMSMKSKKTKPSTAWNRWPESATASCLALWVVSATSKWYKGDRTSACQRCTDMKLPCLIIKDDGLQLLPLAEDFRGDSGTTSSWVWEGQKGLTEFNNKNNWESLGKVGRKARTVQEE
jgi:hypothetical protein